MINTQNFPSVTNRRFGVEIEFVGTSPRSVERALLDAGIEVEVEGYNHITREYWKITSDGSLAHSSGMTGELVSPILQGVDGLKKLYEVIEAINTIESITVNRTCGVHVHLDAADLTVGEIRTIYERYSDHESQIDAMMPRSRRGRGAQYVQTLGESAKRRVKSSRTKRSLSHAQGKYHKVNLTNLTGRGTIEFRQHSGTTDFRKISHWISFLMQFVEVSRRLVANTPRRRASRPYNNFRTIIENLDLNISWGSGTWNIESDLGLFLCRLENYELNMLYDGNRDRDINLDRVAEFLQENFSGCYDLPPHIQAQVNIGITADNLSIVPAEQRESARSNRIVDEGFLTGVDEKVKNYIEERIDELN